MHSLWQIRSSRKTVWSIAKKGLSPFSVLHHGTGPCPFFTPCQYECSDCLINFLRNAPFRLMSLRHCVLVLRRFEETTVLRYVEIRLSIEAAWYPRLMPPHPPYSILRPKGNCLWCTQDHIPVTFDCSILVHPIINPPLLSLLLSLPLPMHDIWLRRDKGLRRRVKGREFWIICYIAPRFSIQHFLIQRKRAHVICIHKRR